MILALFGVLMALGVIFILLGFIAREHTELALIGFFFLFLLSFQLMNGTLEYETGTEEIYIYGNNFSGNHWDSINPIEPRPQDPTMAYLFHKEITIQYANYENKTMGIYLCIVSVFGMVILGANIKKLKWRNDD